MFVIFFYTTWTSALISGPLSYIYDRNRYDQGCSNYWWTNLLYVNNFVPWNNNLGSTCLAWGWYMANDFQLFFVSALVLVLWKLNSNYGFISAFGIVVAGWIICIVLTLVYPIHFDLIQQLFSDLIYTKPWARAPPYFIGVLLALFWISSKEQRGHLSPFVRVIGYPVAAVLLLSTVYGSYGNVTANFVYNWNEAQTVFYIAFSRSAFVCGLAIICYFGFRGYGGIVSYFLASKVWGPFARLTYLAYLLHPIIMVSVYSSTETTPALTPLTISINLIAFTVASYAVAALVWLLIEKPFMNLEKFFMPHSISKREVRREPNKT